MLPRSIWSEDRADLHDGPSYHESLLLHPSAITRVRRPRASATARGSESRPCTTRTASSCGRHSANFSPSSAASLTGGPSPRRSLPARSRSPRSMMSGGWRGVEADGEVVRVDPDVQPPGQLVGQRRVGPPPGERPPGDLAARGHAGRCLGPRPARGTRRGRPPSADGPRATRRRRPRLVGQDPRGSPRTARGPGTAPRPASATGPRPRPARRTPAAASSPGASPARPAPPAAGPAGRPRGGPGRSTRRPSPARGRPCRTANSGGAVKTEIRSRKFLRP